MAKYIVKRILLAIVTIWAVATLTFFLMNMVPGGPFLSEKAISPQATAALEAKYGLDKPMGQRYLTYMADALHGDFGNSLKQRGRTVMDIIKMKFPVYWIITNQQIYPLSRKKYAPLKLSKESRWV